MRQHMLLLFITLVFSTAVSAEGVDQIFRNTNNGNFADGYNKSYAVVIGTSHYNGEFPDSPNTSNDATRVKDFLLKEAGFNYIHLITENKVTPQRIRSVLLDQIPKLVGHQDRFILYWSGHGVTASPGTNPQSYLTFTNSKKNNLRTLLSINELVGMDALLRAKQALYLLDANLNAIPAYIKSRPDGLTIDQVAQPSRQILTAGYSGEKASNSSNSGGSLFTRSVMSGLRGFADKGSGKSKGDGVITATELAAYVRYHVSTKSKQIAHPTLFNLSAGTGDFFFFSTNSTPSNGRTKQWYIDQYNRQQQQNNATATNNGRTQQWYIDQYNRQQPQDNATVTNGRTQQWYIDQYNQQKATQATTTYVSPKPLIEAKPYVPPEPYNAPATTAKTSTQYVDYTGGVSSYTGSYRQPSQTYRSYQPKTYSGGTRTVRAIYSTSVPKSSARQEAEFPWPPPKASSTILLSTNFLSKDISLLRASKEISDALSRAGQHERRFYSVPHGFAIVTRLELISKSGDRIIQVRDEEIDFIQYIKGLFWKKSLTGNFRMIAFIVTDQPLNTTGGLLTKREANDLLQEGYNKLSARFDNEKFTKNHDITALIYEFSKAEDSGLATLIDPGYLTAYEHLTKAGWYRAIRKLSSN